MHLMGHIRTIWPNSNVFLVASVHDHNCIWPQLHLTTTGSDHDCICTNCHLITKNYQTSLWQWKDNVSRGNCDNVRLWLFLIKNNHNFGMKDWFPLQEAVPSIVTLGQFHETFVLYNIFTKESSKFVSLQCSPCTLQLFWVTVIFIRHPQLLVPSAAVYAPFAKPSQAAYPSGYNRYGRCHHKAKLHIRALVIILTIPRGHRWLHDYSDPSSLLIGRFTWLWHHPDIETCFFHFPK